MLSEDGLSSSVVTSGPCLCMGQLWKRRELIATLGIGEKTLQRWEQAGLRALSPATKEKFYLSDDVIRVMQTPIEEIPELVPAYTRKN